MSLCMPRVCPLAGANATPLPNGVNVGGAMRAGRSAEDLQHLRDALLHGAGQDMERYALRR